MALAGSDDVAEIPSTLPDLDALLVLYSVIFVSPRLLTRCIVPTASGYSLRALMHDVEGAHSFHNLCPVLEWAASAIYFGSGHCDKTDKCLAAALLTML